MTSDDYKRLADAERDLFIHAERAYFKAGETSDPQDWLQAALLAQQHRNALTSLRAASVKAGEVVAMKVKPLEWESCFPRAWFAATDFETYRIYETDDGATWFLTGGTERLHVADLEAAKAAAQTDYEARIRSALVAEPVKGEPVAWLRCAVEGDAPKSCNEDDDGAFPVYRAVTPAPTASVGSMREALEFYANEWMGSVNELGAVVYEPTSALVEDQGKQADAALAAADQSDGGDLCEDCPPVGYPADKTRCSPCPRRAQKSDGGVEGHAAEQPTSVGSLNVERPVHKADAASVESGPSDTHIIGTAGEYAIDDRASFIPKSYLTDHERKSLDEFESLNIVPGPSDTPPAPQAVGAVSVDEVAQFISDYTGNNENAQKCARALLAKFEMEGR